MKRLYTDIGYADEEYMIDNGHTFIFQVGARGTGKTYGILKYILERRLKFLYLRRTDTESKLAMSGSANPFKPIDPDIYIQRGKLIGVFRHNECDIGYCAALSTFHNVRGMDFSDVDIIYYDEFIPEKAARPMRDEYGTFLNVIETVNRNRELIGEPPVKVVCSANANTLDNPIFLGLEIVNKVATMMSKGIEIYDDPESELTVYMLMASPISEKKSHTALYKLTRGQQFQEMALYNRFDLDTSYIRPSKIKEYKPHVKVGEVCIYKHKNRKEYYVNSRKLGTFAKVYSTSEMDIIRFRLKCINVYDAYVAGRVYFEDALSLYLFEKFFS